MSKDRKNRKTTWKMLRSSTLLFKRVIHKKCRSKRAFSSWGPENELLSHSWYMYIQCFNPSVCEGFVCALSASLRKKLALFEKSLFSNKRATDQENDGFGFWRAPTKVQPAKQTQKAPKFCPRTYLIGELCSGFHCFICPAVLYTILWIWVTALPEFFDRWKSIWGAWVVSVRHSLFARSIVPTRAWFQRVPNLKNK